MIIYKQNAQSKNNVENPVKMTSAKRERHKMYAASSLDVLSYVLANGIYA